jgi:thioredoxin-dependent peroxiredoxin
MIRRATIGGMTGTRRLEAGNAAPEFTLPDQHGRPFRLRELRGHAAVLFFYPRAGTSG